MKLVTPDAIFMSTGYFVSESSETLYNSRLEEFNQEIIQEIIHVYVIFAETNIFKSE